MGLDDGHRKRLKAQFLAHGEDFHDHQLLELLLCYAIPQGDVNELAHMLLGQFGSLAGVLRTIRPLPLKFILFIDDLTFEESDANFNTLKAVLEGSLSGMPDNALIYATTNRRHLIKETFTSREGSEIHASDTRDEAASLSDRFGLVLTYMKPTPQEYADIVLALAADRGIQLDEETLRKGANRFATRKGSRSGRVARQYVDQLESRLAMGLDAE